MTERPTYLPRGKLRGLLRTDAPATASGLAVRVGESSGVRSYHLRKLAEDDAERDVVLFHTVPIRGEWPP